ncbi:replication initiator [Nonomuraea sp. NPDC049684]|uniref:replication initiator n=1 Tax=unclassified Nonomuraea TaxID=2593643 RepID=UPI00378795D8
MAELRAGDQIEQQGRRGLLHRARRGERRPEFARLWLRPWAHMLGFRGHFSSKSRLYSITLGDLRGARALHRAAEARERHDLPTLDQATTLVMAHWRFAGSGYTQGEAIMAEHIRQRVETARKIAAERADE